MKNFKALFTSVIALSLAITLLLSGCAVITPIKTGAPAGANETPATGTTMAAGAVTSQEAAQPEQLSYVSIDINPSIELTLSAGLITEAKAYNEDGSAIILAANVIGLTAQQAVSAIVNEFAAQGYVTPGDSSPDIVITVAGNDEEGLADTLKGSAEQSLAGLGLEADVFATDVAGEIVQTAANCGLSVGRYLVLKQIALKEGISIEEAKDKYGSLKMSELLAMVGDVDEFMGDVDELSSFLDGLTPEQIQILTDARLAFQTAMKNAQQAFLKARTEAKEAFQTARDAAKDAFLKTKDNKALKAAKEQIKQAFATAKKNATNALKQAHIQARDSFMAAVSALGIDPAILQRLIDWDLDLSFDINLDFDTEDSDQDDDKDNDKDDDQDDDDKDDDDEDDDDQDDDVKDDDQDDQDHDDDEHDDHGKDGNDDSKGKGHDDDDDHGDED